MIQDLNNGICHRKKLACQKAGARQEVALLNRLIFLADDEPNIRALVASFLEREGYRVQTFPDGARLLQAFRREPADLVILDIMMPGDDGLTILTELRKFCTVPVMLLTARDTDADFIAGLALGSDDYFTKPFSPMLLVMRVKAFFRRIDLERAAGQGDPVLTFAGLNLDSQARTACWQKKELALTPNEFNLLAYLMHNHQRAVSREELLDRIWGFDQEIETRVADDTVKRLRKKLAGIPVMIETIWDFGFRLQAADPGRKVDEPR
jgi:DNA-binding response OmpR family regulator